MPAITFTQDIPQLHPCKPNTNKKTKRSDIWDPALSKIESSGQQISQCVSIIDPVRLTLLKEQGKGSSYKDHLQAPKELVDQVKNPLAHIENYKDLIEHHVAFRVALFFQQAIVCYNTPFHYKISGTEGQYLKATTLKVVNGRVKASQKDEAAHSSTIPGLIACPREDKDQANPRYFQFLKNSHMENLDNSTVGLPDFVNKVDTLIDGPSQSNVGLRSPTIDLINKVAMAQLNPIEATREFIKEFQTKLIERPNASSTMTDVKKKVVELYQNKLTQIQKLSEVPESIGKKHPLFDDLMNFDVRSMNQRDLPVIRKVVFEKKYEMIKEAQFLEAKIQGAIDTHLKPKSQDDRHTIKLALLYQSRFSNTRKPLEKLFCLSIEKMKKDRQLITNAEALFNRNKTAFNNTLRDIRNDIHTFQKMESMFQANLLKTLRVSLKKGTQSEVATKFKELVAEEIERLNDVDKTAYRIAYLRGLAMSQSTMSRLENSKLDSRDVYITPQSQRYKELQYEHGLFLSKALGVDPGCFFSSFFASKN